MIRKKTKPEGGGDASCSTKDSPISTTKTGMSDQSANTSLASSGASEVQSSTAPAVTLTPKEEQFCQEYTIDLNGTQAAIRAGYSPKSAEVIGYRLLRKAGVGARLQELQQARAQKLGITSEKVLAELALLGFSNMGDYMKCTSQGDPYLDFSNLTREQTAALTEVTVEDYVDGRGDDARNVKKVKFKLSDKRSALVDIGRHIGMFGEAEQREGTASVSAVARTILELLIERREKRVQAIEA